MDGDWLVMARLSQMGDKNEARLQNPLDGVFLWCILDVEGICLSVHVSTGVSVYFAY